MDLDFDLDLRGRDVLALMSGSVGVGAIWEVSWFRRLEADDCGCE